MDNPPTSQWPPEPERQPDVDLDTPEPVARRSRRTVAAAGLVAAGLVGGGVLATSLGASADTTTPSASSSAGSASSESRPSMGGSQPVRSDEKEVTGAKAATLKAAALKAVPGGKVVRVETDAGDAAYEVHMTKADGTAVTVKFDKNLKELRVEAGMGKGDPGGAGRPGHGGPPPSGAPTGAPSGAPSGTPTSGT